MQAAGDWTGGPELAGGGAPHRSSPQGPRLCVQLAQTAGTEIRCRANTTQISGSNRLTLRGFSDRAASPGPERRHCLHKLLLGCPALPPASDASHLHVQSGPSSGSRASPRSAEEVPGHCRPGPCPPAAAGAWTAGCPSSSLSWPGPCPIVLGSYRPAGWSHPGDMCVGGMVLGVETSRYFSRGDSLPSLGVGLFSYVHVTGTASLTRRGCCWAAVLAKSLTSLGFPERQEGLCDAKGGPQVASGWGQVTDLMIGWVEVWTSLGSWMGLEIEFNQVANDFINHAYVMKPSYRLWAPRPGQHPGW